MVISVLVSALFSGLLVRSPGNNAQDEFNNLTCQGPSIPASWLAYTPLSNAISVSKYRMLQDLSRPDEEEIRAETEATRQALEKVVASKIAAAQPKTLPAQPGAPTFIKYTPTQRGPQYNSGATQRIIRMQVCRPAK